MSTTALMTSGLLGVLAQHSLITRLTQREVLGRYRGSWLGLLWPFITPLLMLALYTFVFGVVFSGRHWAGAGEGIGEFAIILFAGLILHGVLAEVMSQCPKLIRSNRNYVKRVVFPLEVLPVVTLGGAVVHALISFMMLLAVQLLLTGRLPVTILLLPAVLAPFALFCLGLGWILTSLGVYFRDISQILRPITTALLFLSPVLYPVSRLPEVMQHLLYLNPLSFIVVQTREVLIFGRGPHWLGLGLYSVVALGFATLGLWWFQSTRRGFADVV
jgi:homopolymeric O-antigen transport system permease protein